VFTFTVPADFELGTHTATLTGVESGTKSATFQVVPKPAVTPTVQTGGSVMRSPAGLAVGVAIILLGGAILLVALRRRKEEQPA